MRNWLYGLFIFCLVQLNATPLYAFAGDLPDFTQIVKDHGASVVNITSTQLIHANNVPGFPDDQMFQFFRHFMPAPEAQGGGDGGGSTEIPQRSGGSGFIISSDGYILTNAHVVDHADKVTVKLTDRREFTAKVIGMDTRTDIALLKINATGLPKAPIGDPKQLQVGEWVLAIGSPFGFENSVTAGIVSAKNRALPDENYVPFIQTDAAVNPGNSGGPLFNMKGQVVGINSQIFSRSGGYMGVSFAIPIDVAMQTADQLKLYGKVRRGQLGVVIQDVNAGVASAFGLARPEGALVSEVVPDGPAARAGIKAGDVILKFNGQTISRSIDLPLLVAESKPGSVAHLDVWRNRAMLALSATLGEMPDKISRSGHSGWSGASPDKLGLVVEPLPHTAGKVGVLVRDSEGLAAQAGIQPGDIILAIGNKSLHSVAQYKALMQAALQQHTIALLIKREGETLYITLQTN